MRIAGLLLLILAAATLLVGLAAHLANHPGEFVRPWEIAGRLSVIPVVLTNLPEHPTTVLTIIAVLLFSIGLVLATRRRRGNREG
jgi:hypothetical protein